MFNLHKLHATIIFLCAVLGIFHFAALPETNADSIQLTGTIRDFNAGNPADFQPSTICDLKTGLVGSTLGSDQKPTFGANGAACITSEETFSQWYNDVEGVNLSKSYTVTLDNGKSESGGIYTYDNSFFFPIDNELNGNEGNDHNYHFTFELHTQFTYVGGESFSFTSDDDLWVFINNSLVVDLGGVHAAISTSLNLDNLGLTKGETYNFDLFFAERNLSGSHLFFQTGTKLEATPTPTTTAIPTLPPLPTLPPIPTPSQIPSPTLPPLPTPSPIPSPSPIASPTLPPRPSPLPIPSPTAQPSPTALPTLPPIPTPTIQPLPSPTITPSPGGSSVIFGFVSDLDENELRGVTITIAGNNYSSSAETDTNGYYEFRNLAAGKYTLTYEKEGYQTQSEDVTLGENEIKNMGMITMEEIVQAKIYGYVVNIRGNPIESVRLRIKGVKTNYKSTTSSDADGFFEFADLEADTYTIFAKKTGYKNTNRTISLSEEESKEIEIVMKKSTKKIIQTPAN